MMISSRYLLLQLLIALSAFENPCLSYLDCMLSHSGRQYEGTLSTTTNGFTCQRWDSQVPHGHIYTNPVSYPEETVSDAENYCRNPDQQWNGGTWCFTTAAYKRWDRCDVPYCECKMDTVGFAYLGILSSTTSGWTCQSWDDPSTHPHNFTRDEYFPDHDLLDAANHCRNPAYSRPLGPWCYTTQPDVEWEYCDVPMCEGVTTGGQAPTTVVTTPEDQGDEATTEYSTSKPTISQGEEGEKGKEGKEKNAKDGSQPKTGASTGAGGGIGGGIIAAIVVSALAVIAGMAVAIVWWRFYRSRPELPTDRVKFENFDNPLYAKTGVSNVAAQTNTNP